MTVTTVASSPTLPTNFSGQRHVARTSSGRIWVAHRNATDLRFSYSDNSGGSWTLATPKITGAIKQWCLFIDMDDNAWVSLVDENDDARLWVNQSITSSSSWTYNRPIATAATTTAVVVFKHPTLPSWSIQATGWNSGGGTCWMHVHQINRYTLQTVSSLYSSNAFDSMTLLSPLVLDFAHTGDGKTATSSPHLWVAYVRDTDDLVMGRFTWTGSGYASASSTVVDVTVDTAGPIAGVFDGSRFVVAAQDATDSTIVVYERNAGDTKTTTRTPTALSGGDVDSLCLTSNSANVWLFASGQTADDISSLMYTRAAGTWGAWQTVEATTVVHPYVSSERCNNALSKRSVVWSSSAAVKHELVGANRSPTTPTWVTTSGAFDEASAHDLTWQHNDPDGDAQHSYKLRRSVNGGANQWWNGTTWTTEGWVTSLSTVVSITAATVADGDSIAYSVATRDADLAESGYSSTLTLTYSAAATPTISSPADGGTVAGSTLTVTWAVSEQAAYRAILYTSGDVMLADSGWVTSTATSHTFSSVEMADSTSYKVSVQTRGDDGLAGAADTNTFSVSFTPPTTPILTVTASGGSISVAIDNGATDWTDSFTRSNSTDISGEGFWTADAGTWGVQSNALEVTALSGGAARVLVDTWSYVHAVEFDYVFDADAQPDAFYVAVGWASASNFVRLQRSAAFGTWNIYKTVGGSLTNVTNLGLVDTSSGRFRLEWDGLNTLTVYQSSTPGGTVSLVGAYTVTGITTPGRSIAFRDGEVGKVAIDNMEISPSPEFASVSTNDVYVRVASGGTRTGERTVGDDGVRIATGVAVDATYVDWAVSSGVAFEYRVLATASSNGTSAWSAWTG